MPNNKVPRERPKTVRFELDEPSTSQQQPWYSGFYNWLDSSGNGLWSRRTFREKSAILMLVVSISFVASLVGLIFLLIEKREFVEVSSHFEELSGYDVPCYSGSSQLCSHHKEESKSNCLKSCLINWSCFTAVYNSLDGNCKLYFGNTPYTMGLYLYIEDTGSISIKKIALYDRMHREADNLFYFVSTEPLAQDQAQRYCYQSFEYAHVAMLPFNRQEEGIKVAKTVASRASAELHEEVNLLLHIVAGGPEKVGSTHSSLARKVRTNLQFDGGRPRNSKMLPVVVSPDGGFKVPDFFTRYYVLCQHDPFNYYSFSAFYANLNTTIRTGQRRRRHALFTYEDFDAAFESRRVTI